MRTISFRFWNGKIMEPVGTLEFFTDGGLNINEEHPIFAKDSDDEKRYGVTNNSRLMQFTGLLDKNGKEIYEGDIINNGYLPYEIVWSDKYHHMGWRLKSIQGDDIVRFTFEEICNMDKIEIIGNIYETPNQA